MIFITHNEANIDACGTSYQGLIHICYAELVAMFGRPMEGDGEKVDAEWNIKSPETGVVATIYNYKDGKNYCGESGDEVTEIAEWHVGGNSNRALALVLDILSRRPCLPSAITPEPLQIGSYDF